MHVQKAGKKKRTSEEVDQLICWLTGHDTGGLQRQLDQQTTFADFFDRAPALDPHRSLVTGTVCGVRVEALDQPRMRNIRYLDKPVDELAKRRPMEKILRRPAP